MKPMTVKDFKESCKKDWDNAAWRESLVNALHVSDNMHIAILEAEGVIEDAKESEITAKHYGTFRDEQRASACLNGAKTVFNIFKKVMEK